MSSKVNCNLQSISYLLLVYLFEQKVPLVVMKHSNFGQDICFNGKIFFLVFHKSLPLWQNILIVDKIFFHGKIFLFFREEEKSFLLWQNILILDKIFFNGKVSLFFRKKKFSSVAKYSNCGQDILQWQSILVFQKKVFLCGKIF